MDTDAIYMMSGVESTYDELCDAVLAEAATLPAETWRCGELNLNDYLPESMQVGIIEQPTPRTMWTSGTDLPSASKSLGQRI
jgi:hypothetical protein